jgi:intracellular multiplication protein IcmO
MLAMGRGLNVSFMLGFQEVSGIYARLGEKTASLLGNANLTIAMRQQDSGRTREWLEKTAGQTHVTQATSYQGAADGAYREARQAEVRTVSRVDWNDLTSLLEGEAIFLFGGRRIYGRVFHAKIDDSGVKRLGRTLRLPAPDLEKLRVRTERHRELAARIERGDLVNADPPGDSPVLVALRDGFIVAAEAGKSPTECAGSAVAALAAALPAIRPQRPPRPDDGTPVTTVWSMLTTAARRIAGQPRRVAGPKRIANAELARELAAIEAGAGLSRVAARTAGLTTLAEWEDPLTKISPLEPPAMTTELFCSLLRTVLEQIQTDQAGGLQHAA